MSKNSDNTSESPSIHKVTPSSSRVRKAFQCPFKSPVLNLESSPLANKRKYEELENSGQLSLTLSNDPSSSISNVLSLNTTPKCTKKSRSRTLSFQSPFQSPVIKLKQTDENLQEKIDALLKEESELDDQILELEMEGFTTNKVKEHIDQLHLYNDIKDSAQIVMGKLAEIYEITIKEIHQKFNAPTED